MKKITGVVRAYFKSTDNFLLLLWLVASVASVLFLYSIQLNWPLRYSAKMQMVAMPLGFVVALFVSFFDYHSILKLWRLYVPIMVLLMLFTVVFGRNAGDANRNWIDIPLGAASISIQPSEFLKICFITTLALHLSKSKENLNDLRNVALIALHGIAYFALMHQDFGSLCVFFFIFITIVFCSGLRWRYIILGLIGVAAMVPIAWYKVLSEDQKIRFLIITQPELNKEYAYQQLRGLGALSIGGRQGVGLTPETPFFVPKIYNDMVFTFIGEAVGFIGALGVMLLLAVISFRILYDATRAIDDTGRYICVGIFSMLISQAFINLGMCLRVLPVIGVTLPLFSSGGTSVLSLYIALGLVLSVYRYSSEGLFTSKSAK